MTSAATTVSGARPGRPDAGWRAIAAGPAVALVTVIVALFATH